MSADLEKRGLDRGQWMEKLEKIDQSLRRQNTSAKLTLVGSAIGILAGQPSRTSMDLDIWRPRSQYQVQELRQAVEAAGILFDPKATLEPETPYVQMVDPGIVQTGKFLETETIEQFGALRLERPPIANLIAAKLLRAEPKDVDDIAFLQSFFQPAREDVEQAIKTMPAQARMKASENLVYLDVISRDQNEP
jgi:hypothetical protein